MLQFRYNPALDDEDRTGWDKHIGRLWAHGVTVSSDEPVRVEHDGTEVYDLMPVRVYDLVDVAGLAKGLRPDLEVSR